MEISTKEIDGKTYLVMPNGVYIWYKEQSDGSIYLPEYEQYFSSIEKAFETKVNTLI